MNIDDKVTMKNGRYSNIDLIVSSVNCNRIAIQREDQFGEVWTKHVDISELEVVSEVEG